MIGEPMHRRSFLTLLGTSAAAWPLATRTQQRGMPVVGFLNAGTASERAHFVAAFRLGLKEHGYVEGENVTLESRWAEDQLDRMPALAADLVRRQPNVIVSGTTLQITRAAKDATRTIPIVFVSANDPVQAGLVASFNRLGGNATGVYYLTTLLAEKRLGLLRQLAPSATTVAVLMDPNVGTPEATTSELQGAARVTGQTIAIFQTRTGREIEAAFAQLMQKRPDALLLVNSTQFFSRRVQIATLANRLGVPTILTAREYAEAGGLMSYGAHRGRLSAGRRLCRTHPQGRQAFRPAGGAANQIRARYQPADRARAQHRCAADAARTGGRSHRLEVSPCTAAPSSLSSARRPRSGRW
jgi:putative ABC transport system substrate-binding protein